jgi:TetR/AcrR family transcriptional regulator
MTENDSNRRQQIIDAAFKVIARLGFQRATIKQIAEEAGLKSPALIYWYFPNKIELLQEAVLQMVPMIQRVASAPQELMEQPLEEVLLYIARSFIHVFENPNVGQLFRIFLSEMNHVPEIVERFGGMQSMMLHFFTAYLQRQIELGTLKPHDPQASARMFIGSLVVYGLTLHVFTWLSPGIPEGEAYAQHVVNTFLDGLRANNEA